MSGAASRRRHKKFCDTEGWDEVKNARGKPVQHHITYELALADGRILRTRVSRPANNEACGPSLWAAILRDQLDVTEDQFWDCLERRVMPPRPEAQSHVPVEALPAGLVHQLLHTLGLSEKRIKTLSKDEAVALMAEHWSKPAGLA